MTSVTMASMPFTGTMLACCVSQVTLSPSAPTAWKLVAELVLSTSSTATRVRAPSKSPHWRFTRYLASMASMDSGSGRRDASPTE